MHSPAHTPSAGVKSLAPTVPASQTLDCDGALELLDHSSVLYLEIVQGYFRELADLPARLDGLLRKTDLQEATQALHTCKGASLTVGAKLLSETCRQSEMQLKALRQSGRALDDTARQTMQAAFERAVADTRQAIADVMVSLGIKAAEFSAKALAGAGARALVTDLLALRNLLARSDMRAIEKHKILCTKHSAAAAQLQSVSAPLKAFDFAQAVVQCDELIRNFSAPQRT
jgi:HPt (histidine-containing phosphotransfer) domain-containing protein